MFQKKSRQKGKLNRCLCNPEVCHNFNHIATEGKNFSLEDNIQLSSKNEVVFNDILEVLPGISHYDPVTDIKSLFIFQSTTQDDICVLRQWSLQKMASI